MDFQRGYCAAAGVKFRVEVGSRHSRGNGDETSRYRLRQSLEPQSG